MTNLLKATGRGGVILVVCLAIVSSVKADPEIAGSVVRFGRSPRLIDHSWAYLSYHLRNPDPTPATVRIVLKAERHGTTVLEKEITIGPNAFLRGRELVTAAPTENYELALFDGDRRIQRDEIFCRFGGSRSKARIFVLNDSDEFEGLGSIDPKYGFLVRGEVTGAVARETPHHWAGYGDSRLVVLVQPKFHEMSSLQFTALTDFVQRGGTLLFISPAGTVDAAKTPLRELLPVDPLRIRLVEELPELDAWGADFHQRSRAGGERTPLTAPEGFSFLESTPVGDGVTPIHFNEYPICRWRRYGLGTVGVFAANPCTPLMKDSKCYVAAWNHFVSWATTPYLLGYPENAREVPYLLSLLTGFRIPGVDVIQKILFTYLAVLVIVLTICFWRKRHATAWVAAAALGVIGTGCIFHSAFRQNASRPKQSATIVDISAATKKGHTGHAIMSFFSKVDCRPTLKAKTPTTLFRALPAPRMRATKGRQVSLPPPLVIERVNELNAAPDINIQAMKPRNLAVLYNAPPRPLPKLPTVTLGGSRPEVAPWPIPDWLPAKDAKAFSIFGNDVLHGTVRNGKTVFAPRKGGLLRLDTFSSELENLFSPEMLPLPAFAVLYPWTEKKERLDVDLAEFSRRGFALELIPLKLMIPAGQTTVSPELVRVESASRMSALLNRVGPWQGTMMRQKTQVLGFVAIVPPYLADLELTGMTIEMDATNAGGNIDFDVGLLPAEELSGPPKPEHWERAVKSTSRKGVVLQFRDLDKPSVLSRQTGRFGVLVQMTQRNVIEDVGESQRVNVWKINSFRVTARGNLTPENGTRRL